MSKKQVKENAHHTIMCLLGVRKREVCPECGSQEWYRNNVYDRCDVEFSDGHVIEGYFDYSDCTWRCDDCDHEID